jgi:hypothetical protein
MQTDIDFIFDKDNICIACEKRPIYIKKRGLCRTCYAWAIRNNALSSFPIDKERLPSKTVGNPGSTLVKYGQEILKDYERLMVDGQYTLDHIGRKYGFSRERARQIFEKIYGFKYTVAVNKKSHDRKAARYLKSRDPRLKALRYKEGSNVLKGAQTESRVFEICNRLGYEITPYEGREIDLVINGYNVEIKSAHKTYCTCPKKTTKQYYHVWLLPSQQSKADFVAVHIVPENKFYVYPREAFKSDIYIPQVDSTYYNARNKHRKYLEAWNLLERPIGFQNLTTAQAV